MLEVQVGDRLKFELRVGAKVKQPQENPDNSQLLPEPQSQPSSRIKLPTSNWSFEHRPNHEYLYTILSPTSFNILPKLHLLSLSLSLSLSHCSLKPNASLKPTFFCNQNTFHNYRSDPKHQPLPHHQLDLSTQSYNASQTHIPDICGLVIRRLVYGGLSESSGLTANSCIWTRRACIYWSS